MHCYSAIISISTVTWGKKQRMVGCQNLVMLSMNHCCECPSRHQALFTAMDCAPVPYKTEWHLLMEPCVYTFICIRISSLHWGETSMETVGHN